MKLIIAEKKSVGEAIAAAIGVKDKESGSITRQPARRAVGRPADSQREGGGRYAYMEGLNAIVSWCIGHVVELAPPSAYNERFHIWRWDDLPILPEQWLYTVRGHVQEQYNVLAELMNRPDVDTIVCATDAGREGELIFRLLYEKVGCKKPVQRLWISSMSAEAIRQGFQRMRPSQDYDRLYTAALCRQKADWMIGINASRIFSLLYSITLVVGRVMTPTLAMIVAREEAIAHFTPELFYTVDLRCGFIAGSQRLKTKEEAEKIAAMCQYKTATVQRIEKKKRMEKPPKLYDLTALQRDANRLFGYSAQQTLDYTQALYESRLVTYPRTDSRYLTGDMEENLPALVQAVTGAFLFTSGVNHPVHPAQVIDDEKVSDHHAIIPTLDMARTDLTSLPAGQMDILQLIVVRLLAAVGEDHEYEETTITVNCEGTEFTAHEKNVLKMGWKIPEALFQGSLGGRASQEKKEESFRIPDLKEGQELKPVMAVVKEGKTTPPQHFTEGTLLAAMETAGVEDMPEDAERKGLGTPATRAGIIESLIREKQVERKGHGKVQYLIPTKLGQGLIRIVPEMFKSPSMTAEWEQRLKAIEEGREDPDTFLRDVDDMLRRMYETEETKPGMEQYFDVNYKSIGTCPRCGNRVHEIEKPGLWKCQNPRCHFTLWQNSRYFEKLGVKMTREIATSLVQTRQAVLHNLRSKKTGREYDAVILMDTDEAGNAKFSMTFPRKNPKGKER